MGPQERIDQAVSTLREVSRTDPELIKTALASMFASTIKEISRTHPELLQDALSSIGEKSKPQQDSGDAVVVGLLHFTKLILADVKSWTSKYCIDCLSQRHRVEQATAYLDH